MKKILITLALVLLTVNTYSQMNSYSKLEIEYDELTSYIKNDVTDLLTKEDTKVEKVLVIEPTVNLEETMELEEWMMTPFTTNDNSKFEEDELILENWMTQPEKW